MPGIEIIVTLLQMLTANVALVNDVFASVEVPVMVRVTPPWFAA